MELTRSDDQVTSVREILKQKAITESSLSDYEDDDFVPTGPLFIFDPMGKDSTSSASSESSSMHYGSDAELPSDDGVEVAGESTSDRNNEGGIVRLARHAAGKSDV